MLITWSSSASAVWPERWRRGSARGRFRPPQGDAAAAAPRRGCAPARRGWMEVPVGLDGGEQHAPGGPRAGFCHRGGAELEAALRGGGGSARPRRRPRSARTASCRGSRVGHQDFVAVDPGARQASCSAADAPAVTTMRRAGTFTPKRLAYQCADALAPGVEPVAWVYWVVPSRMARSRPSCTSGGAVKSARRC